MKSVLGTAFVFCLMASEVQAQALNPRDKAIADAAPDIQASLSAPMTSLQNRGQSRRYQDELWLGLAMFAGRQQDVSISQTDIVLLKAMETRIVPLASAYMQENPETKPTRLEWKRILKVTTPEMAMVDRFQKHFMGDFWLARAAFKLKVNRVEKLARPTASSLSEGGYTPAGSMSYGDGEARHEINRARLMTALHCASAVRKALGLPYVRPAELPVSIRLLWDYAPMDYDALVEGHLSKGVAGEAEHIATGAAACGDEAQFTAYIETLKASIAASVSTPAP